MSRDDLLFVEDILEAIKKIQKYIYGFSYETFIKNDMAVDAVIRNFEIIGEAATRISSEFKAKHDAIEWKKNVRI
jgi:uncharacterized protein with HEPN domain